MVVSCDLPDISAEAVEWLKSYRAPGVWAVQPRLEGSDYIEALFSYYDLRSRGLLERCAADGFFRSSRIAENDHVIVASPPEKLAPAWRSVNTPEDLKMRRKTEG
jgi:molybdopterin-guanine dinucleotide biosynthesis protein A